MALGLVLDPTSARTRSAGVAVTPVPPWPDRPLDGLRIGLRMDEHWQSWAAIGSAWTERWEAAGASVSVFRSGSRVGKEGRTTEEERDRLIATVDVAVFGLCNCGACTMLTVRDGVTAIGRGVPTIVVTSAHFAGLAAALATGLGVPGLPLFELPFPVEGLPAAELARIAEERYPELLGAIGVHP